MTQDRVDLRSRIIPQKLKNNLPGQGTSDTLTTTDYLYLRSWEEMSDLTNEERRKSLTGLALCNYGWQSENYRTNTYQRTGAYFAREA